MHAVKSFAMRRPIKTVNSVRGIVLIEVLVALLVFILGVLGLVGLQGAMTRAQTESKFRSDAAFLATEAIGRMWADVTNVATYNGTGCASVARCKEWQDKVGSTLPGGNGAVALDASSGDATVTVSWTSPAGDTHKYVTSTTVSKGGS
jgi:type IV pilus assembly protein PilV